MRQDDIPEIRGEVDIGGCLFVAFLAALGAMIGVGRALIEGLPASQVVGHGLIGASLAIIIFMLILMFF